MTSQVTYFVERDDDGVPWGLSRVVEDERGLRGENYVEGRWVEEPRVVRLALDPLWADQVSERDVPALMAELDS
jgi:hypothetical protein